MLMKKENKKAAHAATITTKKKCSFPDVTKSRVLQIFYDNIINFEENVRLIVYYQQTFFQTKSKTYNLKIKEHRKIKFA